MVDLNTVEILLFAILIVLSLIAWFQGNIWLDNNYWKYRGKSEKARKDTAEKKHLEKMTATFEAPKTLVTTFINGLISSTLFSIVIYFVIKFIANNF